MKGVGATKKLVETPATPILTDQRRPPPEESDFPKLVKSALNQLKLVADDTPNHAKAANTNSRSLMNLATISNGLAQLRNAYGSGHGKLARTRGLGAQHARLAVGAATTLDMFTHATAEEMARQG